MAARRLDLVPSPVTALPMVPSAYPGVVAARELLDRVAAERDRAEASLTEAGAALENHRAAAAAQMLADLAAGATGDDSSEADLLARIDAARRRLQTATAAVELARQQHQEQLSVARVAFSRQLRPTLVAAMAAARAKVHDAITVNEQLRRLAAHGREHDEQALAPWEAAYPLPSLERLAELDAAREALFAEPEPLQGRVLVRFTGVAMPYNPGDTAALPADEAILQVRAGLAVCVHDEDARRLGLHKLVAFDKPQWLKLLKDFTPMFGVVTPEGTKAEFDAATAARLVNLGLAEPVK